MTRIREHWWNAEFDLSLSDAWDPRVGLGDSRLVRELSLHWMLAAGRHDSVRVDIEPPESFLEYLRYKQIEVPAVTMTPAIQKDAEFSPVGWNRRAIELNLLYDDPQRHPSFEAVRKVNGKLFARELEHELFGDAEFAAASTAGEVERFAASCALWEHGWVAKMEHGNAGLGNRRFRDHELSENDRKWADDALKSGPLLLERWLPRVMDVSTLFVVDENGRVDDLSVHETVHTVSGAVIGAIYGDVCRRLEPWLGRLAETANHVAGALSREGYWGPVCLDAFVWRDEIGGTLGLRPLVEINARQHASAPWQRLADCWGACVYGRFATARKLNLPTSYREFDDVLDDLAWRPEARRGILLTSPLCYEDRGRMQKPRKIGLLFRGDGRSDVLMMETEFRRRFER